MMITLNFQFSKFCIVVCIALSHFLWDTWYNICTRMIKLNVRILQYQSAGFTWEHCAPQLVKRHVRRLLWLCIVSSIFLDNSKISLYESISMSTFPYIISLTSSILPHNMQMHINWNIAKTTWQKQSFLSLLIIHLIFIFGSMKNPLSAKEAVI